MSPENKNAIPQTAETSHRIHLARILGGAAIVGAVVSLAIDARPFSPVLSSQASNSDVAEARVSPDANLVKSVQSPETGKRKDDCTSIRTRPNYIYMGRACLSRGDSFTKIGDGHADKGWAYGVIRLSVKNKKDIYKCGFVREGILPKKAPRPRSISHCKKYFPSLVKKGNVFFRDYNCGPIKNGYDPCIDGTYYSPIAPECPNRKTYENHESDNPSPLNVYGTGQGGFRGVKKENRRTSVHYRTNFTVPTSSGATGIVVRAPKWGWGDSRCVAAAHRDGGPLKHK